MIVFIPINVYILTTEKIRSNILFTRKFEQDIEVCRKV